MQGSRIASGEIGASGAPVKNAVTRNKNLLLGPVKGHVPRCMSGRMVYLKLCGFAGIERQIALFQEEIHLAPKHFVGRLIRFVESNQGVVFLAQGSGRFTVIRMPVCEDGETDLSAVDSVSIHFNKEPV